VVAVSLIIRTTIPHWYYVGGDYDRAIEESRKVTTIFPDFPAARETLIAALLVKGRYDDALTEIQKTEELLPKPFTEMFSMRGYTLARMGKKDEVDKILAALDKQRKAGKEVDSAEAFVYIGLREYDKAIDALERVEATSGLEEELIYEPLLAEIRLLPRFQALLKKAGLKQEAASLPNDKRFLDGDTAGKSGPVSSGSDSGRPG
jgi:tetratricopeptide (TPR) repeat protein